MTTMDSINKQINELVLLLGMAQRMADDIKDELTWVKVKGEDVTKAPQEPSRAPVLKRILGKRRIDNGHVDPKSPFLARNVKVFCQRNPDVPYEEVARRYGVHINDVIKFTGNYQTKQEIEDAEAETTN